MIRVCVAGATGRVGAALCRAIARTNDLELVGAVARSRAGERLADVLAEPRLDVGVHATVGEALATAADVLVDFTSAVAVRSHVLAAIERGVHVVVGSSGLSDDDYAEIDRVAHSHGVGVFAAGNFAITAVLLQHLATIAARHVPAWEVIDYAGAAKPDAPSGTARELAGRLAAVRRPDIAVPVERTLGEPSARGVTAHGMQLHSVRLPGFLSSVEVVLGLPGERLTLRHEAIDAAAPYVGGVLLAIRRVGSLRGVVRGLDRLLDL